MKSTKIGGTLFLCFMIHISFSQANFTQNNSATELAAELSAGGGFTITNPIITNGDGNQVGIFSNGTNAGLTLDSGIILTTGRVDTSFNNISSDASDELVQATTYDDSDLVAINPLSNEDTVIYEFDFTISGTEPKIFALDYQFASEEYPIFVCSDWNDIFGFFVSGGDLGGTSNLASIEGSNVAVNFVNSGTIGSSGDPTSPCELGNSSFFVDNGTGAHHMVYNGFTIKLRAYTILRPGITYHMKMAIADTLDRAYDSAVFVNPIQIFDLPPTSDIDFDGVDDYVNTNEFMGGLPAATMMAWLNLDSSFSAIGDICGQDNFKIFVDANNRLKVTTITDTGIITTTPDGSAPVLNNDQWYHATASYDGGTGTLILYLNGEEVWQTTGLGATLDTTYTDDFSIGRNTSGDNRYFYGNIDEVRVYNLSLSEKQIQEQVYQEIENVGGFVAGSVIPKSIDDNAIAWNSLILYYNMNLIYDITIIDNSEAIQNGFLNNITSVQVQTAPLPYVADASGAWTTVATWEHGDVWDMAGLPNREWAIVQITDNAKITTVNSHTHLGLLIDSGSELEVQNDQLLTNTSYVKLDGQIDLVGESQFIQTSTSDLDITSAGYLERDQQGKANLYEYNHWSSPVSSINTTANNTDYTIAGVLRDGTDPNNPLGINFVGGLDGAAGIPITLADYWIFKYADHPDDYDDWFNGHVGAIGNIAVGEGYSQKGPGVAGASQNYVFTGKPNNGVIQRAISANNVYLVGNPYPSAIDANQFILDNISDIETAGDVIGSGTSTGALYYWEHWGGASHLLAAYQGGYATYNLTGATLAIPDPDVSGTGSGSVLPQRYIPVGQGFFVQGSATGGTIEFNNGQRIFETESGGNSVFFTRNAVPTPPNMSALAAPSDEIKRVYFRFTTPEGPQRQLLLGVKEGLADGINYGYDAKLLETQQTDCAWKEGDTPLVIQSIGAITDGLELPLEIKVGVGGVCKFETESLADLPDHIEVYFKDKELNTITSLEAGVQAIFELAEGEYNNRFYVVFRIVEESSDVEEVYATTSDDLVVYYDQLASSIKLVNPTIFTASNIKVFNVLGQEVYAFDKQYIDVNEIVLPTNVASGTYLVRFIYNEQQELTKKIMIKK